MRREAAPGGPGLRTALAAGLVLAAAPAAAATPISLTWDAPAACPQVDAVREWLSNYLGDAADPAGYPGVRTRGELTRAGAGWQLRLVIERDGVAGERSVRGGDCSELARAGALALAIALEPKVGDAAEPPTATPPGPLVPTPPEPPPPLVISPAPVEPPAPASPPVVASPVVVASPAAPPMPESRRPLVAHALRVSGGLEAGLLPGVGGGVTAGYALRSPWLRLELVGGVWPARARDYADRPGVGSRATLATLGLRVCPTLRVRAAHDERRGAAGLVELPLCAGLELGALAVRGEGFEGARALVRPWLAVEVQPAVVWRFARRVALWAGVALVVPIRRPSFRVEPLPDLWSVGVVGIRGLLGLEVQLGGDPPHKK